jgi:peptidyl-prolyl cis-trans isomerase C
VFIRKKIPGKQLEFNMVEQQIKQYLDHRRYRQAIGDYLYSLARDADIEGIELKLEQENIIVS